MYRHNFLDAKTAATAESFHKLIDTLELFSYIKPYIQSSTTNSIAEKLDISSTRFSHMINYGLVLSDGIMHTANAKDRAGKKFERQFFQQRIDIINETGIFNDALAILDKMGEKEYELAKQNLKADLEAANIKYNKSYNRNPDHFRYLEETHQILKPKDSSHVSNYPATLEQFKQDIIEVATSAGVKIDPQKITKQKSVLESIGSIFQSFIKDCKKDYSVHEAKVDEIMDFINR